MYIPSKASLLTAPVEFVDEEKPKGMIMTVHNPNASFDRWMLDSVFDAVDAKERRLRESCAALIDKAFALADQLAKNGTSPIHTHKGKELLPFPGIENTTGLYRLCVARTHEQIEERVLGRIRLGFAMTLQWGDLSIYDIQDFEKRLKLLIETLDG